LDLPGIKQFSKLNASFLCEIKMEKLPQEFLADPACSSSKFWQVEAFLYQG
jgi:hypothetical protein